MAYSRGNNSPQTMNMIHFARLPIILDRPDILPNGKLLSEQEIQLIYQTTDLTTNRKISKKSLPAPANRYSILVFQGRLLAIYHGTKRSKLLGKGVYGRVKLAQDCLTAEFLALKILDWRSTLKMSDELRTLAEAKLLATDDVPVEKSIIYHHSTQKQSNQFFIPMRFIFGMPMSSRLIPRGTLPLTILSAAIRLGHTLHDLHHVLKIAHCDLHEGNILFDYATNRVTIIDFGLAKKFNSEGYTIDYGVGHHPNASHIPPEARDYRQLCMYSAKTDAYAFGSMLHTWLSTKQGLALTDSTNPRDFSPALSLLSSARTLQTLINQLKASRPEDRPTINDATKILEEIVQNETSYFPPSHFAIVPVPFFVSLYPNPQTSAALLKQLSGFQAVYLIDDQPRDSTILYSYIYRSLEKYAIYVTPFVVFENNDLRLSAIKIMTALQIRYNIADDKIYCMNQKGEFWQKSQLNLTMSAAPGDATQNLSTHGYPHTLFAAPTKNHSPQDSQETLHSGPSHSSSSSFDFRK